MIILIVDDSRAMRAILLRTLRQAGFESHTILEAGDGTEAMLRIRESKPDLILSDMNMPGVTGIELLQKLQTENIDIPLGFITSESSQEAQAAAADAGARFFITKPFSPERLQTVLSRVLNIGI
ncbi:MAG: response regulator [Planctomycetota bacterium]